MAQVFRGLDPKNCLVYLDDIVVFGKDFTETMQNLELVFKRLEKAHLKLKPKKCRVFQTEVEYLGHIVSEKGIQTDPKKVNVVAEWPIPQNVRDVRSFLGLASYYRKFIPDFSTIANSLTQLTQQDVGS